MDLPQNEIEIIAVLTVIAAAVIGFSAAIYMIKNYSK